MCSQSGGDEMKFSKLDKKTNKSMVYVREYISDGNVSISLPHMLLLNVFFKGFGMWRSMRRKSRPITASESELSLGEGRSSVELHEIPFSHHRRTRSCTRR